MSEWLVVVALGIIVVTAVAFPLVAGRARYRDAAALEADVERYRQALAGGTVCPRCRFANPPGSRYCAECGSPVAPAEE